MRIDKLKIDRQFVQKLDSSERSRLVTRTIIDLAKRLDLDTCAEGIENEAQQEYLLNYGCNEFQGFYYGEPQPIDSLEGMLNKMSSRF
jgi:EAL domain-containing protein (putative c-di-GMP-specific phosphodiesterase class I)